MGRPSTYRSDFAAEAHNYCLLGATNDDLAQFFEVNVSTIKDWMKRHEDFCLAVRQGKTIADSKVARAMYDKAIGGDTTACIFWLKNRQKHAWRDTHAIDHSGKVAVDPIQLLLSQVEGSALRICGFTSDTSRVANAGTVSDRTGEMK